MNRLSKLRVALLLLSLGMSVPFVTAQENSMPPTTTANGTVKEMKGNVIHVVNEEGDQYYIKLPDRPQSVSYRGTADPSFLRPGMIVRFAGRFDKKGNLSEPLTRLEIFTPPIPAPNQRNPTVAEEDRIGVFPEAGLASKDLFADRDDKKPTEELTGYRVAGRVTGVKNNKLMVAAGETLVQVEVAADAQVGIDIHDWRLLQVGDKVVVDGWYNPMQKSHIFANQIEITGSETLGVKKNVKRKPDKEVPAPETASPQPEKQ